MYIIAGLGNPGRKYALTRHNVGFMAVDALAERLGCAGAFYEKFDGLCAETRIGGEKALLIKPQTFMNESGVCVAAAVSYYRVPAENIILIHDDIEFPFGTVKIRAGGGPGTHNGMKSVIAALGFGDFPRLRVGIGPERDDMELYEYVLANFNFEEREQMPSLCARACDIIETIITDSIDSAMNRYNPRRSGKNEKKEEDTKIGEK